MEAAGTTNIPTLVGTSMISRPGSVPSVKNWRVEDIHRELIGSPHAISGKQIGDARGVAEVDQVGVFGDQTLTCPFVEQSL